MQPDRLTIPRTGETVPLPTTDADGIRLLDFATPDLTTTMRGLYQISRAQGHEVLVAYTKTLEVLRDTVESHRNAGPEREH